MRLRPAQIVEALLGYLAALIADHSPQTLIAEVVNFAADQHAADAFFWATWQLRPIPDRLEDPR